MNEENVLSQLKLTREMSMARQAQLVALDRAVVRLKCQGSSRDIRIMAAVAVFLSQLATRAETLITSEIRAAFAALDRMKQLPDNAQWEYRMAHTLGVAEGLNRAGRIQGKIIEQAQASLHKACILLMAQAGNTDLPADKKSHQNYLLKILEEVNFKQEQRVVSSHDMARQMSAAFLRRAKVALEADEVTIATTCVAAMDICLAEISSALCDFAGDVVHNSFDDSSTDCAFIPGAVPDPAIAEYRRARLIASGVVSAAVSSLLKEYAPWLTINLN